MTQLKFPEPAKHIGTWAPIQIEPIVGSGERLTVGIVASCDGVTKSYPTYTSKQLQCLFGSQAESLVYFAETALDSVAKSSGDQIDTTFDGFAVGAHTQAAVDSIEQLAEIGAHFCSSLAAGNQIFINQQDKKPAERNTFTQRVQLEPTIKQYQLARYFNRQFELEDGGLHEVIDFCSHGLVANLSDIKPGAFSRSRRDAFSQFYILEEFIQKKSGDILPGNHEAIVRVPDKQECGSERTYTTAMKTRDMLFGFAENHKFVFTSVNTAKEAAERIAYYHEAA